VSWLRTPALGVWEFVVGDDWRTAFGVVAAIALTALLSRTPVATWWVMPFAVLILLVGSTARAIRTALRSDDA
jgi:hypothetical protein